MQYLDCMDISTKFVVRAEKHTSRETQLSMYVMGFHLSLRCNIPYKHALLLLRKLFVHLERDNISRSYISIQPLVRSHAHIQTGPDFQSNDWSYILLTAATRKLRRILSGMMKKVDWFFDLSVEYFRDVHSKNLEYLSKSSQ